MLSPSRNQILSSPVKLFSLVLAALLLATNVATAQTVTVNNTTTGTITATPGSTLTVSVSNGAGLIYDWVGLFQIGASSGVAWWYMNGTQTAPSTPLTSVSFTTTAPTASGQYEFRYFADESGAWGQLRATSVRIIVGTPPAITVNASANPITVAVGAALTVNVTNGAGTLYDWVGFFPKGATNGFAWWY